MEEQTIKLLNKAFLWVAVLIVGVLVYFAGQLFFQNKLIDNQSQNQVTVSGQGKVYAKPDVALMSLGVATNGANLADVTSQNTEKMNAVIEAVKALGVDEKDIQSTNYSLTPNYAIQPVPLSYPYYQSSGKIIGYSLEQDIQVKVRDFTKIGSVLSQATLKGANLISQLQFTIDDPEQFKQEARAKAIAQAKDNAQNLANESGIKLGKLINVYENYYPYPVMYSNALGKGGGEDVAVPAPTIEPGQQEINVTVNLTYKVK